jgi:glycosyltransferase involved in cell wall biosynthesis
MSLSLSVVMPVYNERYLVAESIARVLGVESPLISRLDLIVVDDGSTDGTREILRKIAAQNAGRVTYVEHEKNAGKGAAVATGVALARGEITVIQDADLEYNPKDLPKLMLPFVNDEADAVFGSRFLSGEYRRVLYYRHSLGNMLLTTMCNVLTDLNLSDMETCYKAVRTPLFQSIPLRSRDFRIEPEIVFKLKKRGARIFEVPISYAGRTYEEGKKIGFKDALRAFSTMIHWYLVDDIYRPDDYGSNILVRMSSVPNFNRWMADAVRPRTCAARSPAGRMSTCASWISPSRRTSPSSSPATTASFASTCSSTSRTRSKPWPTFARRSSPAAERSSSFRRIPTCTAASTRRSGTCAATRAARSRPR